MRASTKAVLLLTTSLSGHGLLNPTTALANGYISSPTYSRDQLVELLSSESPSCAGEFKCGIRTLERSRSLYENPHFFNILNGGLKSGPDVGRELFEGYQNTKNNANAFRVFSYFVPRGALGAGVDLANQSASDPDNFKVSYNVSGLDDAEELRRQSVYAGHEYHGKSKAEFQKWFLTKAGQAQLEKTAYFTHRAHDVLTAKPGDKADELSRFAKEFGLNGNDAQAVLKLYRDTLNEFNGGAGLAFDYQMSAKVSAEYEKSLKPIIERQREIESLREQVEQNKNDIAEQRGDIEANKAEVADLEERIKTLEESQSKEISSYEQNAKNEFDKKVDDYSKIDEAEQKITAEEALNSHKANPVYVGGFPIFSERKGELKGAAATVEFVATTATLLGASDSAAKFMNYANNAIRVADAAQHFSELKPDSFSGPETLLPTMGAMTNVMGAVSFFAGIANKGEDAQQKMMEELFKALGAILENQRSILEGVQNLKQGQASILYSLNSISQSLDALKQDQFDAAMTIMKRFDDVESQIDRTYLDTRKRLISISDQLDLRKLFDALNFFDNRNLLAPLLVGVDVQPRLLELAEGMAKVHEALSRKVGDAENIEYDSALNGLRAVEALDGGISAERLEAIAVNDRRGHLQEILASICGPRAACSAFNGVPDADRLRGLTFLYLRAAEILSQTESGREVITGEENSTLRLLKAEVATLKSASRKARDLLPAAFAQYESAVSDVEALFNAYKLSALKTIGGAYSSDAPFVKAGDPILPYEIDSYNLDRSSALALFPTEDDLMPSEAQRAKFGVHIDWETVRPLAKAMADRIPHRLLQHLKLGYKDRKSIQRIDIQREKKTNANWVLYHHLLVTEPVFVHDKRVRILLGDDDAAVKLLRLVTDNGFLKSVVGFGDVTSDMVFLGALPKCGDRRRSPRVWFDRCYSSSISDWIFGNNRVRERRDSDFYLITIKRENEFPELFNKSLQVVNSNETERIRKILSDDFKEAESLRNHILVLAAEEIRQSLVNAWVKASEGLTEDFSNIPNLKDNQEIPALLQKVRGAFQRVADARLAYDTALRLGYGQDCVVHAPQIRMHERFLRAGDLARSSELMSIDPSESNGLVPLFDDLNRVSQITDAYEKEGLDATFPKADDLAGQCAVGVAGVEQLDELYALYSDWVKHGAIPISTPH